MENTISSSSNNPENSATHYVCLSGENINQEKTVNVEASYSICKHNVVVSKGDNKKFKCEECGDKFTRKWNLKMHKRIHTGEKNYHCNECGKAYFQQNNLNQHLKIHIEEKPFKCDMCGKGFVRKIHLEDHVRHHKGEKPYVCETCFHTFTAQSNLTTHKKKHRKDRPFECNKCQKRFKCKSGLKNHQKEKVCEKKKNTVSDKQVTSTEQTYAQAQFQTAGNVIATGATPFYQYQPEETKNMEESVGFGQDQEASSTGLPTPSMPSHKSSENLTRAQFIKMKKFRETETKDEVFLPVLSTLPMEQGSVDPTMLKTPLVESNLEQPLDLSLSKKIENSSIYRPRESSTLHATEDLSQGASASGNPAKYMYCQQIETSQTNHRVQNSASFFC